MRATRSDKPDESKTLSMPLSVMPGPPVAITPSAPVSVFIDLDAGAGL
jgi:hypothetical protein